MKDKTILLIRKWFNSKTGIDLMHDPSLISLVNEIEALLIHDVVGRAEDLLDKFAQDEGFGNWETVVLNCHHSVIRSVAIAAVNQALRQPLVSGRSEQLPILDRCGCEEPNEEPIKVCMNCNGYVE